MALSQNGRPVLLRYGAPLVTTAVPGTGVKFLGGLLPGDINLVAMYVAHRWNTEVEPLVQAQGCWGFGPRLIRGSTSTYSNHASGTAWDMNAAIHPLDSRTLGSLKLERLRRIQSALGGVVRFGAFYTGRVDEMHAEIDAGDSAVAQVASKIRAGALPGVPDELRVGIGEGPSTPTTHSTPSTPTVPSIPTSEEDELTDEEKARLRNIETILGNLQNAIGDPANGVFFHAASADAQAAAAKASADNAANISSEVRNWITDPNHGVLHAIESLGK